MIHLAAFLFSALLVGDTSQDFSEIPCRFYDNLFIVEVRDREGTRHRMLIDSGSPITHFYPKPRLKQKGVDLWLRLGAREIEFPADTSSSERTFDSLGLWEGLIGDDFLSNYQVAFDYVHGKLWMRSAATPNTDIAIRSFLNRFGSLQGTVGNSESGAFLNSDRYPRETERARGTGADYGYRPSPNGRR